MGLKVREVISIQPLHASWAARLSTHSRLSAQIKKRNKSAIVQRAAAGKEGK